MKLLKNLSVACAIVMLSLGISSLSAFAAGEGVDTGSVAYYATKNSMGFKSNERYDLSFQQSPLRDALQFLSWIAGINIVIPSSVTGTVTVSFKNISVGDAISAIVKSNALDYTVEGDVVRVGTPDQFQESGGDLKTETVMLRYARSTDLLTNVKSLLSKRGSVISDDRTNSLTIRDVGSNNDNVKRFIDGIDVKDAQVLIETKIMEATRSFSRSLGIQWGANRGADGSSFRVGGTNDVGQADSGRDLNVNLGATSPTSGVLIGALIKGLSLDVQITAAEKSGDAYVIADPSIVTSNGKSAKIRSGTTLLIQTTSTTTSSGSSSGSTSGNGLQQIETGVELNVTPQITINDYVKLEIETTTSSPDYSRSVQGIPVIVDNVATTTVLVRDGETTVIGGLTRYQDSMQKSGVPGLSKIPIVGNLFKSKDRVRENTELIVFIKPSIIRVEGTLPAQMRVHEIDMRREAMYLDPILNPEKELEAKVKKAEKAKAAEGVDTAAKHNRTGGHKYIRN